MQRTKSTFLSGETLSPKENISIFSARYWKAAAGAFSDLRIWVVAALFVALRVAVKFATIDISANMHLSWDCYVNSVGSLIYGPLMGLAVGAVSDTIGCIVAPTGPYFLPFILVEMGSSFIFGLFFWRRKLTVPRILLAKFTVNMVVNVLISSVFMKWYYSIYYSDKTWAIFNLSRLVKNLVTFPLEALLISFVFAALLPAMRSTPYRKCFPKKLEVKTWHYLLIAGLTLFSVWLLFFYIFFLKDFLSAHNISFL